MALPTMFAVLGLEHRASRTSYELYLLLVAVPGLPEAWRFLTQSAMVLYTWLW